jgi:hypothetical protein
VPPRIAQTRNSVPMTRVPERENGEPAGRER